MNSLVRVVISILICYSSYLHAVLPYISMRSQSVDAARDLMGWTDKVNLYDMENLYITGAITLEGTRSFDPDALAHCLFGFNTPSPFSSNEVAIQVAGSQVPNRNQTDWLADYFGLSPTYQSTLFFRPRVTNFIMDFNVYVGLDEWFTGLYFRAHAPLVISNWNLHFHEEPISGLAPAGYPAGYFTPSAITAGNLLDTASDFFSAGDIPDLPDGVTFEPLAFARLNHRSQQKTALAEIQMALGYNFLLCPCYHLGLNFRVYAPTGNRPNGIFTFQPIVGNGKHWEVGAGFSGHYTFWESCDEESSFGFYCDGNFTHLCRTSQTRTFDLKGKPNSRYMLAERLGAPNNPPNLYANVTQGTAAGSTVPSAQFKGAYAPVANLTTLPVKVSNAVQVDIVALFNYTACGLSVDLGYNFWALSCEKISISEQYGPTRLESGNVWALKGDAMTYGFSAADSVPMGPAIVPLSATESLATIYAGTNGTIGGQNTNVDNAEFAMWSNADDSNQLMIQPGLNADPSKTNAAHTQQLTSNDPVFLSNANINIKGAESRGLSHKIFAHLSYTWNECEDIMPYIGVGGKAEFGPRRGERQCNNIAACQLLNTAPPVPCDDCRCQRCNLSEWGVWVKGGIFWS